MRYKLFYKVKSYYRIEYFDKYDDALNRLKDVILENVSSRRIEVSYFIQPINL